MPPLSEVTGVQAAWCCQQQQPARQHLQAAVAWMPEQLLGQAAALRCAWGKSLALLTSQPPIRQGQWEEQLRQNRRHMRCVHRC